MRRLLAILSLLTFAGCAGGTKPAGPPSSATRAPASPTPTAPPVTPAPRAPAFAAPDLEGGWSRAVPGGTSRVGLMLRPDGTLGLVGFFDMNGVAWRLDGEAVVLSTSSDRYPDGRETRLHIEGLAPTQFVLSGSDDFDGAWDRRDFATLKGTVTYRQRIALTPEAVVQVELRDVTLAEFFDAPRLAKSVIRPAGKQVPIEFALDYEPTDVLANRMYAVSARIMDRGQLQFVTDTPMPVLTRGAPAPVEIVVGPVR